MTTLTLQPDATAGKDQYIGSVASGSGGNAALYVGELNVNTNALRTLIAFDLSTLPDNAIISSNVFSLYANGGGDYSSNARTARIFRLKVSWSETLSTWTSRDGSNNWATAGGFGAADCEQTEIGNRAFTATETLNAFKDFALTPTTKAGLDLGFGWLIKMDTESDDGYEFSSSDDATAANRPKLVIVYTLPIPYIRRVQTVTALVRSSTR